MKTKVETTNAPAAPAILSQAIVTGSLIFVSGQIHSTPDGKLLESTVEEKMAQIMKNVSEILKAADADLKDVVKVTLWVTEISDLPKINEVYKNYFPQPLPAREAICVKALPLGATIEISVIAER